ncbi:kinase-like domain-containing protein [Gigaspora rosea]|uniref:Kinase-like domain-containing protein n=1 Tax=Gigaspora rosea TaxID=44941 RepID=A0A397W8V3_9GLOM|nr:kinase-like domain-containing protein [Gigaspora rosea]
MVDKIGSEEIYGVLPYIAPEIFDKRPYTTESDIYSFGIIMWEILYGKSVYYNREFNQQLQIEICCNNLRPSIVKDIPQCYINLMKECWEKCPENRPTAEKIYDVFTKWNDDERILLELSQSDNLLNDIENVHGNETKYRSRIYYSTKYILDATKQLL